MPRLWDTRYAGELLSRPRFRRHDCVAKGPTAFDVSWKLISMGQRDFVLEKIGRYERPSKLLLNCIMPSGFRARSHPASLWLFNLLKCHRNVDNLDKAYRLNNGLCSRFLVCSSGNIVRALKTRSGRSTSHVVGIIISYDIPETLICSTTGGRARPFRSSMFLNASSCSEMDVAAFRMMRP